MKLTTLVLLSVILLCGCRKDPGEQLAVLGVFSNDAEGFYIKTLMLDENGKGFYFTAVGGVPVLWTYDKGANRISVVGPSLMNGGITPFSLHFDSTKRELAILDSKVAQGLKPLRFISPDIPREVHEALKKFDGTLDSVKMSR